MTINLADLRAKAERFIVAHDRMVELNEGIGGLGVYEPDLYQDFINWSHSSTYEHADTVLALIAAADTQPTVKPSREWLSEALMQIYDHGTSPNALREADALLALWPGRTEAEVKAEALREAADEAEALNRAAEKGCGCNADWLMPDLSIDKVRARADRIEAQS